jgi:class 3 adenylate cyclase
VRVDRCFAFIDLCGFTAFADRYGDEQVVVVLAALRTTLREASARRGVRVVKWLGDGAMLCSTMVDAVAGLVVEIDMRMALEAPSLPIRAGLAVGPAVMFEGDDYIGSPVNIAARLCARARPRELLATVEVAARRQEWIHVEPVISAPVRGLAREVGVCALSLRDPGQDVVLDPVCGLMIARELSVGDRQEPRFCSGACVDSWTDSRGSEGSVFRHG